MLDLPDARESVSLFFRGVMARIRYRSLSVEAILLGAGPVKCDYPCCESGSYPRFQDRTYRMAFLAALSILGADLDKPVANHVRMAVDSVFLRMHQDWLVRYHNRSHEYRRAALMKMLITDLLRGRRHRRRRQKIAAILGRALAARMVQIPPSGSPDPQQADRIDVVVYDAISETIRRLSDKACITFLYRSFLKLSEEEIARRTHQRPDMVRAYSSKATGILGELVEKQIRDDSELRAVLREAARREGVLI